MKRTDALRQVLVSVLTVLALWAVPTAAADKGRGSGGDDDRVEVRASGKCTAGSAWRLRVRAEDDEIEVEFRVEPRLRTGQWKLIVLHERRIVIRRTLKAPSGSGSIELKRTIADWWGTDSIVVRATGPRSEICRASAIV
jgi:hypothetical protein